MENSCLPYAPPRRPSKTNTRPFFRKLFSELSFVTNTIKLNLFASGNRYSVVDLPLYMYICIEWAHGLQAKLVL